MSWRQAIEGHYRAVWRRQGEVCAFRAGPIHQLPADFAVLKFRPDDARNMWTYATCCMSQSDDDAGIELHMHSPRESIDIVELLYAAAHFHRTRERLGLWHTVYFGRPWLDTSACEHGFISLPYLDGPALETLSIAGKTLSFYWLLPVTHVEVDYATQHGVEALEQAFERASFNYLDPARMSVV